MVLDLPRGDVHDELAELERIAGAGLADDRHTGLPPPLAGFGALFGCVCPTGGPLAGAGASATVWPSLAFRTGRHLQSRLHKHRCNMNTTEPPAERRPAHGRVIDRSMTPDRAGSYDGRNRNSFSHIQTGPLPKRHLASDRTSCTELARFV